MPLGYLQWHAYTGIKGLYVAEYRYPGSDFDVYVNWRGFWELKLHGKCTSVFGSFSEPNGSPFTPSPDTIPSSDLETLVRDVVQGRHLTPPADFFAFRTPAL